MSDETATKEESPDIAAPEEPAKVGAPSPGKLVSTRLSVYINAEHADAFKRIQKRWASILNKNVTSGYVFEELIEGVLAEHDIEFATFLKRRNSLYNNNGKTKE